MDTILSTIESPLDVQRLTLAQLRQLAGEMREALCSLVTNRSAHFASNLGVVELCLALHTTFDFREDRLIWDTGHQIYPHKLITGRYHDFPTIRTKGGLMGYPNPTESEYDLFMTGHAGSSVSTALGLKSGDDLLGQERHSVAVIGDGAFPSGIVFEALNNAGELRSKTLVILNDNKMSICPRVGGMGQYLDQLRTAPIYNGIKSDVQKLIKKLPLIGARVEKLLLQFKASLKAGLHGGMLFEQLGFRYIGPVDGHDIGQLRKYLKMVKKVDGPVLLHVMTEKGHGFLPAANDPVCFHTPQPFECDEDQVIAFKASSATKAYTDLASAAIFDELTNNPRVTVLTAAMCQGNKLERVRDAFPERFFDTGICESHAVAFAAGQAKAGLRPIVDIYSTFLQRSFDQIFQEVSLQNLPVAFLLDRAGLVGPDGPTHHGVFDLAYLRMFPNMVVCAPADEFDLQAMIHLATEHDGPMAVRYPKTAAVKIDRPREAVEVGKAETLEWGRDGVLIACGTLVNSCLEAVARLREEDDLDIGVINARFVKPLDTDTILRAIAEAPFAVTIEEGVLQGGFGSAVVEAAVDAGLDCSRIVRLGVPDRYIDHAERGEQLAELGLDVAGFMATCRRMAGREESAAAGRRPHAR